jgi:hypothetical protein
MRKSVKNYQKNFPERCNAVNRIWKRIRLGKMEKGTKCEACDRTDNIIAHHWDYSKPLSVIWLCSSCHKNVHKNIF